MSDFDIAESEVITDNDDIANLSDIEGYDDEENADYSTDSNIEDNEIDMDDEPVYSSKILGKLVIKKPIVENTISTPTKNDAKNNVIEKKKIVITKKTSSQNTDNKGDKDTKETKIDAQFQFNEQTIDFYTKDITVGIKEICVKKSAFRNDTVLLCLLFKARIMTEYRCNIKKCKTGKTWLGKPIQLLIHRKNGRIEDLTTSNLELICPNCYIIQYGLELFQKVVVQTIYKCKLCGFPLNKFSNTKKKDGYCLACENRMINASYYSKQSDYINELKETIDETSALKKDEFTNSKYYNEVSQYKTFKDNGKSKQTGNNSSKNEINTKPIIKLNMEVPNLDDLINEDI